MNKTIQALDDLLSSIITLIPSWLGMLKSTRTLTFIATVAAIYITAAHSGLSGTEALVVAILEAATGISLIAGKSIRGGLVQTTQAAESAQIQEEKISLITCPKCGKKVLDATWCSECGAVLRPAEPPKPQYTVPPAVSEIGADQPSPFLRWMAIDSALEWDLTQFDPQVRMDYAMDILNEVKKRLDEAWLDELTRTNAAELIVPVASDFSSYEATEAFKKKIRDITPGCMWLTINQNSMLRGYQRYFRGLHWVTRLYDKNINWQMAYSINKLAEYNYSAVATK